MKATLKCRREAMQLFRSCLVNGLLDEARTRKTVQALAAKKPRGYLGTLSHFRYLIKLESEQHAAKIESAQPLAPELRTTVQNSLARMYGPGLNVTFVENQALIGGMRIRVGSDVYDGSVRARLAALNQSF